MKTPTAFFPISAETLPIFSYINEHSDIYSITTLLTYPGSGLLGKDIGYADNRFNIDKSISSDFQENTWSTLLIANQYDVGSKHDLYNFMIEILKKALALGKTVVCAAKLKPEDLNDFKLNNIHNFRYLPEEENLSATSVEGRLYSPITPIMFIGGLIEEANVLEVFLKISGKLQKDGYNIISLSPNSGCALAGVNTFSRLTYPDGINNVNKIYAINNLIKSIEESKHPDLIIIQIPEAIMEYNDIIPNGFGFFSYVFSRALIPDLFLCCLPCGYKSGKFNNAINEGVENRLGFPIDYIHVSNAIVDGAMIFGQKTLTVVHTTLDDVDKYVTEMKCDSKIPVFNLINDKELDILCKDIKSRLNENQITKIII